MPANEQPTIDAQYWPTVMYQTFILRAVDCPNPAAEFDATSEAMAQVGRYGVVFKSAGNDMQSSVRLQIFRAEPDRQSGEVWDEEFTAEISVPTMRLRLDTSDGGLVGDVIEVESNSFNIHILCKGRQEAANQVGRIPVFERGPEKWLVRLWPA